MSSSVRHILMYDIAFSQHNLIAISIVVDDSSITSSYGVDIIDSRTIPKILPTKQLNPVNTRLHLIEGPSM